MKKMTFEEMCKFDPAIKVLYETAKNTDGSHKHFCANFVWYKKLKPTLIHRVGFERLDYLPKNKFMGTEHAYKIAYQSIYDALPPCKECMCL